MSCSKQESKFEHGNRDLADHVGHGRRQFPQRTDCDNMPRARHPLAATVVSMDELQDRRQELSPHAVAK